MNIGRGIAIVGIWAACAVAVIFRQDIDQNIFIVAFFATWFIS